jgi:hypothetical protein
MDVTQVSEGVAESPALCKSCSQSIYFILSILKIPNGNVSRLRFAFDFFCTNFRIQRLRDIC